MPTAAHPIVICICRTAATSPRGRAPSAGHSACSRPWRNGWGPRGGVSACTCARATTINSSSSTAWPIGKRTVQSSYRVPLHSTYGRVTRNGHPCSLWLPVATLLPDRPFSTGMPSRPCAARLALRPGPVNSRLQRATGRTAFIVIRGHSTESSACPCARRSPVLFHSSVSMRRV
jgi:hypothetical protein